MEKGAGQIGPDGKVIVHGMRTARGGAFRPELVSVSLNHHEQSDWLLLRRVVEEAVEEVGVRALAILLRETLHIGIPPVWAETLVYGVMLLVLVVRPGGLLGKEA